MEKMFTVMAVLIMLAGCTGGSCSKAVPAEKPDTQFRTHVQGLESDDTTARRKAFDYLAGQGEKGLDAIRDFCIRHTDDGWGKEEDGLKCRISTDPILYYEAGAYEPNFKGNVIRGNVKVELKNVSPNTISIFTHGNEILVNPLHHVEIEPYVGEMPKDWGVIFEVIVPKDLMQIAKDETITENDWICDEIRCFHVEDKVVSFRHYLSMESGIYYISYNLILFLGPEHSGPSGGATSNRICFALLPAKKK